MAKTLTKKQRGFVKDYVKTGIGSLAIKLNYDVANDNTARTMGAENLSKPLIKAAVAEAIPDWLLREKHLALLNKEDSDGNIDVTAVSRGLDMGYKLKGSYAPDKSENMNMNVNVHAPTPSVRLQSIVDEVLAKLKEAKT